MGNWELIEPFAAPEVYVDGFTEHTVINGNMSCVGYRIQRRPDGSEQRVVAVHLIWPAASTAEAIADACKAQTSFMSIEGGPPSKRH